MYRDGFYMVVGRVLMRFLFGYNIGWLVRVIDSSSLHIT